MFCYTIRIPISKILTGTYEGGYTYVYIHSYSENVSVWDPTAHFEHC